MTLQPLFSASLPIQLHVLTLVLAFLVGTWQFALSRKGAGPHRAAGMAFLLLMFATAVSALFIHVNSPNSPFFGFSVLHLYVPLIFGLVGLAWYGAATYRRKMHRFASVALYFGSLVFTGIVQVFLVPGMAHRIFFSK